jgi:phage baseplate assembly protein W
MNISYPFLFNKSGRTASSSDAQHMTQMIEQLLFTNPGERVNQPDFGSGLMQLVFAPNSSELASALQFTMQAAMQRWLGDLIQVQSLLVTNLDSQLKIDLQYVIRSTTQPVSVTFTQSV